MVRHRGCLKSENNQDQVSVINDNQPGAATMSTQQRTLLGLWQSSAKPRRLFDLRNFTFAIMIFLARSIPDVLASTNGKNINVPSLVEYKEVLRKFPFSHDQPGFFSAIMTGQKSRLYQPRRLQQSAVFIDIDKCKADLYAADAEKDGKLSSHEYVSFINIRSDNYFWWASSLSDFKSSALAFVPAFNLAACNCYDASCCNQYEAAIDITGAGSTSGDNGTSVSDEEQEMALFTLCRNVYLVLQQVMTEPPTPTPSISPTIRPAPTLAPTLTPTTAYPYTTPVELPSESPAATPSPVENGTNEPFTGELELKISFGVTNDSGLSAQGIIEGTNENQIITGIEEGLRGLVLSVLVEAFGEEGAARFLRNTARRRLEVSLKNVEVGSVKDIECDPVTPSDSACTNVEADITLELSNEDRVEIEVLFISRLLDAINQGRLTFFIRKSNSNTSISDTGTAVLVDTRNKTPTAVDPPPQVERMSLAAIVGIASAAFAAGVLTIGGLYTNRERTRKRRALQQPDALDAAPTGKQGRSSNKKIMVTPDITPSPARKMRQSPIATKSHDIVSSEDSLSETRQNNKFSPLAHQEISEKDVDGDMFSVAASEHSSSSAGNSGWSSSAGMSSHHTGSFDSHDLESGAGGSGKLVPSTPSVGVVTTLDDRYRSESGQIQYLPLSSDSQSTMIASNQTHQVTSSLDVSSAIVAGGLGSHQDLDAAIERRDWAAVGATTALLSENDEDASSDGDTRSTNSSVGLSGVGAERAAELDRLVDTGDWEGVVLAASKFENESMGSSSTGLSNDSASFDEAEFNEAYSGIANKAVKVESPKRTHKPDAISPQSETTEMTSPSRSIGTGSYTSGSGSSHGASTNQSGSSSSGTSSSEGESESYGPSLGLTPSRGSTFTGENSGAEDSAGALQKRAEIREEVEALVRRVVPDEIDNIDEMMNQFKGREEELVETLRTMQERQIAQRERAARNKNAKLEAKREVRQKRKLRAAMAASGESSSKLNEVTSLDGVTTPQTVEPDEDAPPLARFRQRAPSPAISEAGSDFSDPSFTPAVHEDANVTQSRYDADGEGSEFETDDEVEREHVLMTMGSSEAPLAQLQMREKLAQAVDAGNWEAVGELGALLNMGDASVSSASTNELRDTSHLSEYDSSGYSSAGSDRRFRNSKANRDRVAELDSLIDAGNWEGVVLAAKKYGSSPNKVTQENAGDEANVKPKSWRVTRMFGPRKFSTRSTPSDNEGEESSHDSYNEAEKALQEEQEALAQAEIWMAIAAQSKQEGSTEAKGASDAADWAIERSLSALQTASRDTATVGVSAGVKDDTSV